VFETSLENAIKYFPSEMSEIFAGENPADIMIQNIMFVRHETLDQFNVVIARYYPGDDESKANFNEISYTSIPILWNGKLELFTYDERFFVGFEIKEGQIETNYTKRIALGDKRKNQANLDQICTTRYYPVGYKVCNTEGKDCHTTIERYGSIRTCAYGPGGPIYYNFPVDGGSLNRDPVTDGGGNDNFDPTPPEMPEPNLRVELDKSIKENAYLRCIVGKLQLSAFVNELALFDGTKSNMRNVILKVGETEDPRANAETSDDLGPYRIEITLNEDRLGRNSLEMARTILHELIHAELYNAIFHKNGSPIDNDFEANFSKYVAMYKGDTEMQHNYMAENMVGKMAGVLSQIHTHLGKQSFLNDPNVKAAFPKGLPSDFYHGIAWSGLKWTDKWRYDLPSRNTYVNYQEVGNENLNNECN